LVRRLGLLLRQAEIPVQLDQFFLDENPGGPRAGWPKWCEDSANESQCVLIIASEGWFAAYDKKGNQGSGLGAATEADLFRQSFYDQKGENDRIRLAFLHQVAADEIPPRLRTWHQFRPFDSPDQLVQLLHWIGSRIEIQGVGLSRAKWPSPIEFQVDMANRTKKEWPAIVDLLSGQSRERILLIEGETGFGKSELIRQAKNYARKLGILVIDINLKGGIMRVEDLLGTFSLEASGYLPNFIGEGASKMHLLRKDLRMLNQPLLIIFDHYEDTKENKPVADWISLQLLAEIETSLNVVVIVGGQQLPAYANANWRHLARHLVLGPITEFDAWKDWVLRRYPGFQEKGDILTLIKASDGSPLLMSTLCEKVAKD
jgi:hypothetical protein